jgi:hypothetical protein
MCFCCAVTLLHLLCMHDCAMHNTSFMNLNSVLSFYLTICICFCIFIYFIYFYFYFYFYSSSCWIRIQREYNPHNLNNHIHIIRYLSRLYFLPTCFDNTIWIFCCYILSCLFYWKNQLQIQQINLIDNNCVDFIHSVLCFLMSYQYQIKQNSWRILDA